VTDHGFVTTLYDWGREPRLWIATEYTDETLADRVDVGPDDALRTGLRVAEAVAHAHQRGVVHAGLDPRNVVYTGTAMERRPQPLLDNVGLLDAIRTHFEPSRYLDPRYAAPEYFSRKYGTVDHATDVYHVGAVLYGLVTGRAPHEGEYGEVRRGVLSARPPPPSSVDPGIPAGVDDVVRKAMAKQKLTRYESATHVVQDLRRVLGENE
jgi:serine/threonine protein kinase